MRMVVWGIGGFFAGGALAFVIGMALPSVIPISQFEGAYAMGVAFFWTPVSAFVGAIVGLIVGLARRKPGQ